MKHGRARRWLPWAGVVVSLLFAYVAVRDVDFQLFGRVLARGDHWLLAPAIAVLAFGIYLRVIRWQILFTQTPRPPTGALASSLLIGYLFNAILPARAGEVARVLVLHEQAGTSRAQGLATVVSERVLDVLVLLGLLLAVAPSASHQSWLTWTTTAAGAAIVLIAATLIFLAFWGRRLVQVALRPLSVLPNVSRGRTDRAAANVVEGLAVFRRPDIALRAIALTAVSWLVIACSFRLCMMAVGLGTGMAAAILVVVAVNLAVVVPSGPAGLGVFEAAAVLALAPFGVDRSQALAYAVIVHAINVLPVIAVGYVALHRHVLAGRRATPTAGTDRSLRAVGKAEAA
jgi:uncharacterized protein (TIRG00374 family)